MANSGYIFIKGGTSEGEKDRKVGYKAFYGPHDKGSAKPSFCYPRLKDDLKEEIRQIERSLADGYVAQTRVMKMKLDLKEKKAKLDGINQQEADVAKMVRENKDAIVKRREELGEIIREALPSYSDVKKRRVNPFRINEAEKKGMRGSKAIGEIKKEYQVLSHALGEESNTAFLQKD